MKKLLLILLSAILFSCGQDKKDAAPAPVPEEVISEEIMTDVLVDLHMIEASLSLKMQEDHGVAKDTSEFYDPYKKHNVLIMTFDESFKYYASQPEKLNAIYEEVLNRLNQRQAEVMKSLPKDTAGKSPGPKVNLPRMPKMRPGAGSPEAPFKK